MLRHYVVNISAVCYRLRLEKETVIVTSIATRLVLQWPSETELLCQFDLSCQFDPVCHGQLIKLYIRLGLV